MLRKVRTVVLAAVVAVAGVSAAQAAVITIGSFSLIADDAGFPFIDVENSTTGAFVAFYGKAAVFTNVTLTFANDESLTEDVEPASLGEIQPGTGVQFLGFNPAFVVPPSQQAYAALSLGLLFVGGGTPAGQLIIDLLDVSGTGDCADPDAGPCAAVSIFYETADGEVPVPEPATLLLLAGGLGAMAARRVRRRE